MATHTPLVGASAICFGMGVLAIGVAALSASSVQLVALLALAALFVFAGTTLAIAAAALVAVREVTRAADAALLRQGDRLRRWALDLEAANGLARAVNLSGLIAPIDRRPPEERIARSLEEAKARYAEGTLTDAELERELARAVELEESVGNRGRY